MGKKILLADDSITIQKVIELTFSDEDFDVITVGNGRLALEKLPEVRPDIVLCDIIMPEKDGYEVCEEIKANAAFSHLPVLLLTGAFEPFDQERATRAGYDGSLAKPFEPETLIAKVKDLLARAPVRTAAPPQRPVAAPPPAPPPPPPVLPFQRPPAPPAPSAAPSFIPDEPFGGLDTEQFSQPPAAASSEGLAPVTEEESATLLAPPPEEAARADAASTVMFRATDLPWSAPLAPPPVASPVVTPPPAITPEPEPVFVPEPAEAGGLIEEPPVFEEVLEEDLDFGATNFEPGAPVEPSAEDPGGTVMFSPEGTTLPPVAPEDSGGATGAFPPAQVGETTLADEPAVFEPAPAPAFEPEPARAFERAPAAFEPEPAPVFEPEPAPVFEPEPAPVFEPEPAPVFEPEPVPVFEPEPAPVFEPEPAPVFEPEPAPVFEPEPAPVFEPAPVPCSCLRLRSWPRPPPQRRSPPSRSCGPPRRRRPSRSPTWHPRWPKSPLRRPRRPRRRNVGPRGDGREDRPAGRRPDLGEGRPRDRVGGHPGSRRGAHQAGDRAPQGRAAEDLKRRRLTTAPGPAGRVRHDVHPGLGGCRR